MIALLIAFSLASSPVLTPAQDERAHDLMTEIRCMVCEGQPISESNAGLALDMRAKVLELVADGKSDAEVRDWIADRYGESALLRPRVHGNGLVLWIAPLLFAAGALFVVFRMFRGDRNVNKSDQD